MCLLFMYLYCIMYCMYCIVLCIYVFSPSYELVKFESISGQSQKETALLPKTGNVSNVAFSNIFCMD